MHLYEIEAQINEILDSCLDYETGEIDTSNEDAMVRLSQLNMEKQNILTWIAKKVLNTRSDMAALKAEEDRLKERRLKLERLEEHLISILDRECRGQKTDFGVATLSYRRSQRVDISDEHKTIEWLKRYAFDNDNVLKTTVTINKTELKKILKDNEVPGAVITDCVNASLR